MITDTLTPIDPDPETQSSSFIEFKASDIQINSTEQLSGTEVYDQNSSGGHIQFFQKYDLVITCGALKPDKFLEHNISFNSECSNATSAYRIWLNSSYLCHQNSSYYQDYLETYSDNVRDEANTACGSLTTKASDKFDVKKKVNFTECNLCYNDSENKFYYYPDITENAFLFIEGLGFAANNHFVFKFNLSNFTPQWQMLVYRWSLKNLTFDFVPDDNKKFGKIIQFPVCGGFSIDLLTKCSGYASQLIISCVNATTNLGSNSYGQYLFLEMKGWASLDSYSTIVKRHQVKQDGPAKQIDCRCNINNTEVVAKCYSHSRDAGYPEGISIQIEHQSRASNLTCQIPDIMLPPGSPTLQANLKYVNHN